MYPTRKQFFLLFAHTSSAPFSLIETLFDLSVNTYTHMHGAHLFGLKYLDSILLESGFKKIIVQTNCPIIVL